MKLLRKTLSRLVHTRRIQFFCFVLVQLIISINGEYSVSEVSCGEYGYRAVYTSLVILFSMPVSRLHYANGAVLPSTSGSVESSSSDEVTIRLRPRILRRRWGRQISMLAPALQTMGCLPKFFCVMNSKTPSTNTSTLNDLAYFIKFAMVDDLEDSAERGKDGLHDKNKMKEDLKFEHLADEELITTDPHNLKFVWKEIKDKLRNKMENGRMDEELINKMIADMEKEAKHTAIPFYKKVPGTNLLSGLKTLIRVGRSAGFSNSTRTIRGRRKHKAFWETSAFHEQMKLAARIGKTSSDEDECTTTFNLCPFTVQQMKSMVSALDKNPNEDLSEEEKEQNNTSNKKKQPNWYQNYENSQNIKPMQVTTTPKPTKKPRPVVLVTPKIRQTTTPNSIYLISPENIDRVKPSKKIVIRTTTPKPKPKTATTERTLLAQHKKPYIRTKEPEDDEIGFDNPRPNLAKYIIPGKSKVKVVKLSQVKTIKQSMANTDRKNVDKDASEDEYEDEGSVNKDEPVSSEEYDEDRDGSSEDESLGQSSKPKLHVKIVPKDNSKIMQGKNQNKGTVKAVHNKTMSALKKFANGKIGFPRPKYTIRHKLRNRPRPTTAMEQDPSKLHAQKKKAIAASDEANRSESEESKERTQTKKNKESQSLKKQISSEENASSEEADITVKPIIAEKLQLTTKPSQKYQVKNKPQNKLEFKVSDVSEEEEGELDPSDESVEEDEVHKKKQKEIAISSEKKTKKSDNSESIESGKKKRISSTSSGDEGESEEDDEEVQPHSKAESRKRTPPTLPPPPNRPLTVNKHGGILKVIYSRRNRPLPQHPEMRLRHSREDTEGEISDEQEMMDDDDMVLFEIKEQIVTPKEISTPSPSSAIVKLPPNLPPVYAATSMPAESHSHDNGEKVEKKPDEKPIVVDPNKTKFPSLRRFTPSSKRRKATTTSTTVPPSTSSTTSKPPKKRSDDDNSNSREQDSSASKEDDNKTAESKESSEEDAHHIKKIFTKSSVMSLAEGSKETTKNPPSPPPPISNWVSPNMNETKTGFSNITKSANAQVTLITPTKSVKVSSVEFAGSEEKTPGSNEDKDDDSVEAKGSKEVEDKQSEEDGSSEEENKKKSKHKGEDDEAENKEPVIIPVNEEIPELGDDVVSTQPQRPSIPDQSAFPAPAVAPVSSFYNPTQEVKVPEGRPPSKANNAIVKNSGGNKNNKQPGEGTRVVPNNVNPGTSGNPASSVGRPSSSGNRRPGGSNSNNGGNRGNSNNGGNNGNDGSGTETEDSSEEKSEERIGQSSEEEAKDKNATSEEEDDETPKRSRTVMDKNSKQEKTTSATTTASPTEKPKSFYIPYSSHIHPPLPPIYRWKPEPSPEPTLVTKLLNTKLIKPKLKLAKPTKDTFYSKPLSPKLVQYLRDTYGPYAPPPPKRRITTSTYLATKKPAHTSSNVPDAFQQSQIGNKKQAADVIHYDDFEYADKELSPYSKRIGVYETSLNGKNKKQGNRRIRPTPPPHVPPIYGKITFHG